MATWTAYRLDVLCGACDPTKATRVIPARSPVCELLKGVLTSPKIRCVECAVREGFAFDSRAAQAVEDAVIEFEREDRIAAETPLTPSQYMHQAHAGGRVAPPKKPKPFSRVSEFAGAFPDPKSAAANDR